MVERALTYLARMTGGDTGAQDKARRQLTTWLARDIRHQAAWRQAEALWASDSSVTQALQAYLPRPRAATPGRRALLRAIAGGGLALGLGWLLRGQGPQPQHRLDVHTAKREVRPFTLPDGSLLTLDADTHAVVAYYRKLREIVVVQGRVSLDVQPDPDRPLVARTRWGTVRVVGTAFSLSARADAMQVNLERGLVRVWGPDASGEGVLLRPGEAIRATQAGLEAIHDTPAGMHAAWRQGWLVFDATPLSDAVAQWNAWRDQPILLAADPALRAMRVTGSFPARDPAQFLAVLPDVLPVSVEALVDGRAQVRPLAQK